MCVKIWDESCLILSWGIKVLSGRFLNGFWVNLSSPVCNKGWAPVQVCSGSHEVFSVLCFLASCLKLFLAWGADFIGMFLINVKPEICWEYCIKINNFFFLKKKKLYLQYRALSLCLVVADREMWKPLVRLIAFMICSIWVNLFSVPYTISFCSSK